MRLVLASKNEHKLLEFRRILEPMGYEVLSQTDVNVDIDVDETGETFEENAALKARAIYKATGLMTIADDSGLCVDYINGEPGVYSARYGAEEHRVHTDKERCQMVLDKLHGVPKSKRTARFVCVICAVKQDGSQMIYRGECEGYIGGDFLGDNGFGYDPIFMVDDEHSMASLSAQQKDKLSHRGRALRLMQTDLQ